MGLFQDCYGNVDMIRKVEVINYFRLIHVSLEERKQLWKQIEIKT